MSLSKTDPCPRCLPLAFSGVIDLEMLQPLGEHPALARDGSGPCCRDCAAADATMALTPIPEFTMSRIAVGSERVEQHRLPGAPLGLVQAGIVKPSKPGDFERHIEWLISQHLVSDTKELYE